MNKKAYLSNTKKLMRKLAILEHIFDNRDRYRTATHGDELVRYLNRFKTNERDLVEGIIILVCKIAIMNKKHISSLETSIKVLEKKHKELKQKSTGGKT